MSVINFSGLASGIDTEALIKATSDVKRRTNVTPHKKKVSELEDTNQALKEVKSKLSTLKSAAGSFSTLAGGGVAKQAVSSDETVLTAIASKSASNGSYNLTVNQVAKNATYTFNSSGYTYTSTNDAIAAGMGVGTDTIAIEVGSTPEETVSIDITATTTLAEFVSEFNSESTLATASLVNLGSSGSNNYVIVITTHNTGLEKGEITVDLTGAAAVVADGAFNDNISSQALNAQFTVEGVSGATVIERGSNTVSDLIPGVTFTLSNIGSSTISIGTDVDATFNLLRDYVDAHNDLVEYMVKNNMIVREEDGKDVENRYGALAKTRVDDNALSAVRTALASTVYSDGTNVRIFADLGITTDMSKRDGTLALDGDVAKKAISSEMQSVNRVLTSFGDTVAKTGGTIDQFVRFNGLIDTTIRSNERQISQRNDRIGRAEELIARNEEVMRARFARLESLMSQMQSQQQSLDGILASMFS